MNIPAINGFYRHGKNRTYEVRDGRVYRNNVDFTHSFNDDDELTPVNVWAGVHVGAQVFVYSQPYSDEPGSFLLTTEFAGFEPLAAVSFETGDVDAFPIFAETLSDEDRADHVKQAFDHFSSSFEFRFIADKKLGVW